MTQFFWSAGHIGWAFFALLVFSALCILATDLAWRFAELRITQLLSAAAVVWRGGAFVIVYASQL